jgi:E3 ubiquitin-protein ligase BIG BROTHER-like protein
MGARTPGAYESSHHCHGESSTSTGSRSGETSKTSDEQIAADFEYARRLQEEIEDLTIETPSDDDEQDGMQCTFMIQFSNSTWC